MLKIRALAFKDVSNKTYPAGVLLGLLATCSLWNLCLICVEKLLCAGVEKCYVTVSQYPIRATEIGAFVSRQLQRDFFNCHIVYCEPRQPDIWTEW